MPYEFMFPGESKSPRPEMASKQMEKIQKKLASLNYPRADAPAQSLLFAGIDRYTLLEWLFFRSLSMLFSTFILLWNFIASCEIRTFRILEFVSKYE
jgi:Plant nuclear matrix protein 1 (NMP1)